LGVATLLLVVWPAASASSQTDLPIRLTLEGSYWRAFPSGTVKITEGGRAGSANTIDVGDDLDLGAADAAEGSIDVALGRHHFSLSFEPLGFDGVTTTRRSLRFHGAEIAPGTRLRSDLGLRFVIPSYEYELLAGSSAAELRAGLLAYVWTFDTRLHGSGPGGLVDERRRFTHALPALTVSGALPIAGWKLAAGSALGVIGSDRYAIELTPELRRTLWKRWSFAIGYHWMKFAFHETSNRADLTLQGPFVSVALDVMPAPISSPP
jgi:hypothetical protein